MIARIIGYIFMDRVPIIEIRKENSKMKTTKPVTKPVAIKKPAAKKTKK
jgi:hypothetical protein